MVRCQGGSRLRTQVPQSPQLRISLMRQGPFPALLPAFSYPHIQSHIRHELVGMPKLLARQSDRHRCRRHRPDPRNRSQPRRRFSLPRRHRQFPVNRCLLALQRRDCRGQVCRRIRQCPPLRSQACHALADPFACRKHLFPSPCNHTRGRGLGKPGAQLTAGGERGTVTMHGSLRDAG